MLQLRRIISSESWVPEIDGLRFVAIMAVLFFHITGEISDRGFRHIAIPHLLNAVIINGDRGVALFFVISGFVLARPFYHQHRLGDRAVRLPFYFLRRLTRLEPPYLLSLLLYFIAFAALHAPLHDLLVHTLVSAAYLHNLVYPGPLPFPNFVTWSLEVEVQFYLLAPLLGQIYRIQNKTARRAVWVALTLAGCTWSAFQTAPPVTVLTYAGFFPAGFLLADIFDDPGHNRTLGASESYLWDVCGLVGWVAIFTLPPSLTTRSFLPVLIVPLYLACFHGRLLRPLFRRPLLTTIGGMCYSLYLLHPLVMSTSFRFIKRLTFRSDLGTFLVQTPLLLAAILAFGTVYFVLIERPCMNKHWPQELLAWFRSVGRHPA